MDDIRAAMTMLKSRSKQLTKQQYNTIKGQILSGNINAAMKGIDRILAKRGV